MAKAIKEVKNEEVATKKSVAMKQEETKKKVDKKTKKKKDEKYDIEQHILFCQTLTDISVTTEGNEMIIYGPKKTIFISFDIENQHFNVCTISNKYEVDKNHAKNILTLKSKRALQSYTACHSK